MRMVKNKEMEEMVRKLTSKGKDNLIVIIFYIQTVTFPTEADLKINFSEVDLFFNTNSKLKFKFKRFSMFYIVFFCYIKTKLKFNGCWI